MRYPGLRHVNDVVQSAQQEQVGLPDGRWVIARPLGFQSLWHRLACTWLVFTGKADALVYEEQ